MILNERAQLIDSLIDGDISEADFIRLEAEFSVDPGARQEYYDRLALSVALETMAEAAAEEAGRVVPMPMTRRRWVPAFAAIAAVLVALVSLVSLLPREESKEVTPAPAEEPSASGFAVVAGQSGAVWAGGAPLADGALVPPGPLRLASGVVQLELFSGVTVVVEGEAEFEIDSPMEMRLTRGKVRAHVPEPAHGFRINTAEGRVVDLGTEFALEASPGRSEVHVIEGQIEWHPGAEPMRVMDKGESIRWDAKGAGAALSGDASEFVGVAELAALRDSQRETRHAEWQKFSEAMRHDPRLVAYYQMGASAPWGRQLANAAEIGGQDVGEAAIVAAARVPDRWGRAGGALDFSPAGSRVRVNIPGEYHSITLVAWVKINSLDRWYNSLFLTDGHDLHEPHWQIMDDGRLFFSVKKHDKSDRATGIRDKHIFYSPPFWNPSLSGQWLLIATVYDVEGGMVTHYLNGQPLSREPIPPDYLVETVSIGAASLGNWSEPMYRTDAAFTIRNLNGSMDEFALFAAALTSDEISDLYAHGKP